LELLSPRVPTGPRCGRGAGGRARRIRDLAGDKDRAPCASPRLLHLRGTLWRFGEAVR